MSRFLTDADGFNDEGGKIGEPTGVWAEIAPYGGAGASQNALRYRCGRVIPITEKRAKHIDSEHVQFWLRFRCTWYHKSTKTIRW